MFEACVLLAFDCLRIWKEWSRLGVVGPTRLGESSRVKSVQVRAMRSQDNNWLRRRRLVWDYCRAEEAGFVACLDV